MDPLTITGRGLDVDGVVAVARGRQVRLDPAAVPAIERSRAAVEELVASGRVAYGITTGFGRFKDKLISPDQVKQLQLNLVRSHAVGVGPELDAETVRAMMLVRANTLAMGFSGVRPQIIQLLLEFLNRGICPRIPAQGSLGASGDLTPLCNNYQIRNESLIRNNYVAIFKDDYTEKDWEDVELSLRPLALLNDQVERDGRRLLVVIVPQKAQIPDQPGTSYVVGVSDDDYIDSTKPQDVIMDFCEAESLTCFDLLPVFRRQSDQQLYWLSDQHLTVTGHQVHFSDCPP